MSKLSALLDGAKNVDPNSTGSGDYLPRDFHGLVEITKCVHRTSKKDNSELAIVEFTVLDSNMTDKVPVGVTRTWIHHLDNPWFGISNMKAFVGAVAGLTVDSPECAALDGDDLGSAMGDDSPLIGKHVMLKTHNKPKKDGGDFTIHTFSPAE